MLRGRQRSNGRSEAGQIDLEIFGISAGLRTVISCSTMLSTPPRLMPGAAARCGNAPTRIVMIRSGPMRRKSRCRPVGHRIDLDVARRDGVARALDVDLHPVIEEAFPCAAALDRFRLDRDHHRILFIAVDDGGNQSIATAGTGAPCRPGPHLRDDGFVSAISLLPKVRVALSASRRGSRCRSPDLKISVGARRSRSIEQARHRRFVAVRFIASEIKGAMLSGRTLGDTRTASVAWIEIGDDQRPSARRRRGRRRRPKARRA